MKKAKKLALSKKTLRNLELRSAAGADVSGDMGTECGECNTAYSICVFIKCAQSIGYTC